ncbi:HAD family hydrolase [Nigerium massiliense]|uniref:HAD family hydrolase n=1 Tax=Nigerium massiliense TaxID=1522317 RepID=UPI000694F7BC|nr:HAD family hydrolase [Nigerium massiliense]
MTLRLIASDLDGTFLSPDGTISELNREAVLAAKDAGIRFVVATGRPSRWLGVLEAIADADPLVICSNGAIIYDPARREVVAQRGLPADDLLSLVNDLRGALQGCSFALERGDLFGCEPAALDLHEGDAPPTVLVATLPALLERVSPVVKLLVFHPTLTSDAMLAAALPIAAGRATVTHSLTHDRFGMLELSGPGVTKAAMLTLVAERLGVDPADAIAFGDMPNDLAMLRWAGRGYVMAEAHPSLHREFETIGSNADSGVGRQILALLGADPTGRTPQA